LINKITWGQRLLRTIMMFPMMFSPILVGFQFKFIFNDNIGILNNALQSLGLADQAIPWLVDGRLAMFSIIFAEVWMSTSVFAILLLAGPDGHAEAIRWKRPRSMAAILGRCSAISPALHHAVRLHRHDHPLAGCGARLRHRGRDDRRRAGRADRDCFGP
jgi:hypothetical protein